MSDYWGCYRNDTIIIQPMNFFELCRTFVDPDTGNSFSGLEISPPENLALMGIYPGEIITPEYNPLFENIVYNQWEFDSVEMKFKRTDSTEFLSYIQSLTNCATELDRNREKYETGGIPYDYHGTTLIVMTDKESSQQKLAAAKASAEDGTRLDTDTWKFLDQNKNLLIFQVSNEDLIDISKHVYRAIQDSYNIASQIFWQMLGCGDVQTLKDNILNNIINLNPWNI
jgi:hypothetical protein